jgi:hypothetical protein
MSVAALLTRRILHASALLLVLLVLPTAAIAQGQAGGVKIGTTGVGLEYSLSLLPKYGARANLNLGSYKRTETISGFEASGKIGFQSLLLLADAHPYRNGFRLSVGLMLNRNTAEGTARPFDPVVRINGREYPAAAVDNAKGEVTFQRLSPYFGVGWGAAPLAQPGPIASFDLGVLYQRPRGTLSVACGPAATALECSRLQADIAAEERELNEDLRDVKMWPVLTLGFGYRF